MALEEVRTEERHTSNYYVLFQRILGPQVKEREIEEHVAHNSGRDYLRDLWIIIVENY
jgi:hypothetical protein